MVKTGLIDSDIRVREKLKDTLVSKSRAVDIIGILSSLLREFRGITKGFKRCIRCGEVKPIIEFALQSEHSDGFQSYCRDCQREFQKELKQRD